MGTRPPSMVGASHPQRAGGSSLSDDLWPWAPRPPCQRTCPWWSAPWPYTCLCLVHETHPSSPRPLGESACLLCLQLRQSLGPPRPSPPGRWPAHPSTPPRGGVVLPPGLACPALDPVPPVRRLPHPRAAVGNRLPPGEMVPADPVVLPPVMAGLQLAGASVCPGQRVQYAASPAEYHVPGVPSTPVDRCQARSRRPGALGVSREKR